MWLTKEQRIEDDERWKSRNVRAELTYCSHYVKDRKNTTNLDLRFYMWLFRNALKIITAQKDGRWKGEGMGDYSCSLCGEVVSARDYRYCPYCGAKMDPIEER